MAAIQSFSIATLFGNAAKAMWAEARMAGRDPSDPRAAGPLLLTPSCRYLVCRHAEVKWNCVCLVTM